MGPRNAQATEEHFRWPELVAVTDVASARQAIDTIVEQGEGARGEWRESHFGRLLGILDEYLELKAADPQTTPSLLALIAIGWAWQMLARPSIEMFRLFGVLPRLGLCFGLAAAFAILTARRAPDGKASLNPLAILIAPAVLLLASRMQQYHISGA